MIKLGVQSNPETSMFYDDCERFITRKIRDAEND